MVWLLAFRCVSKGARGTALFHSKRIQTTTFGFRSTDKLVDLKCTLIWEMIILSAVMRIIVRFYAYILALYVSTINSNKPTILIFFSDSYLFVIDY